MPPGGNGVYYVLSLECREFFAELAKAKKSSKDFKEEMDSVQQATNGFNAAGTALSQAMSGNFVGAAKSATAAVKSLTAAMVANPILAVVAAIVAVTAAAVKASKAFGEYRDRVRSAREENEGFKRSLEQMTEKSALEKAADKFQGELDKWSDKTVRNTMKTQDENVAWAKQQAEDVSNRLEEAKSKFSPNDKLVAALEEEKKAAMEEYQLQLDIQKKQREMYAERKKAQQETRENNRKASEEELDRLRKKGVEGDVSAMREELNRMTAAANGKWGDEASFKFRLESGMATKDEISARQAIEDYMEVITQTVTKEAASAERKAAKDAADKERLFRSQEAVLVGAGDYTRLMKGARTLNQRANALYGEWSDDRLDTATQEELDMRSVANRLRDEARKAKEAEDERRQKAEDAVKKDQQDEWDRQKKLAVASGDAKWLDEQAKAVMADADTKWGKMTNDRWKDQSDEERRQREYAANLRSEARKIREGGEKQPWVEGVVAARAMSIGDVFNNMRGMNGAKPTDPGLDATKKIADNTGEMKRGIMALWQALEREGVK